MFLICPTCGIRATSTMYREEGTEGEVDGKWVVPNSKKEWKQITKQCNAQYPEHPMTVAEVKKMMKHHISMGGVVMIWKKNPVASLENKY